MKRTFVNLFGLCILALLIVACGSATTTTEPPLPAFVHQSAQSLKAYRLAAQMPELLHSLPCYCNCGAMFGHQSLHDCFFNADGTYNDHAASCAICQQEVTDAAQWKAQGNALKVIRRLIDRKYADYGTPTNTPAVP
jgi:hypothetical protein